MTPEELTRDIEALRAEREETLRQANMRLAYLDGQIAANENILARLAQQAEVGMTDEVEHSEA